MLPRYFFLLQPFPASHTASVFPNWTFWVFPWTKRPETSTPGRFVNNFFLYRMTKSIWSGNNPITQTDLQTLKTDINCLWKCITYKRSLVSHHQTSCMFPFVNNLSNNNLSVEWRTADLTLLLMSFLHGIALTWTLQSRKLIQLLLWLHFNDNVLCPVLLLIWSLIYTSLQPDENQMMFIMSRDIKHLHWNAFSAAVKLQRPL